MNTKNVENSDLLALLGGQNSQAANGLPTGESSEFLSLMKELGLGVDMEGMSPELMANMSDEQLDSLVNLAKGLEAEGKGDVLKEISNEDLMKMLNSDSPELAELSEKFKSGQLGDPSELKKLLAESSSNTEQSKTLAQLKGQGSNDFLENLKLMKMKNGKKVAISSSEDGSEVPKMKAIPQGMNEYSKSSKVVSNNIIQFPNGKVEGTVHKSEQIQKGEISEANSGNTSSIQSILAESAQNQNADGSMNSDSDNQNFKSNAAKKAMTIDVSNIDPSNKEAIINKISAYIEQNNIQNQKQLDLVVHHDQLGKMEITAKKVGATGNQIALEIQSATEQGHKFFVDNEAELVKSLNKSGIKLADIKLSLSTESSFASSSDSKNNSQSNDKNNSQGNFFSNSSNSSNKGDRDGGSQRRKELWESYRESFDQASA